MPDFWASEGSGGLTTQHPHAHEFLSFSNDLSSGRFWEFTAAVEFERNPWEFLADWVPFLGFSQNIWGLGWLEAMLDLKSGTF